MKKKWRTMALRMESIVWQELPCLPTRGDLYDLMNLNILESPFIRANPFSVETSREMYYLFRDYPNSQYNRSEFRKPFIDESNKTQHQWKNYIASIRQEMNSKSKEQICFEYLSEIDKTFFSLALPSSLMELPIRFAVEKAYDPEYDPTLQHCRFNGRRVNPTNDGLDYHLLYLTILPVNICSRDDTFFDLARSLNLERSCCCYNPALLIDAWRNRDLSPISTF